MGTKFRRSCAAAIVAGMLAVGLVQVPAAAAKSPVSVKVYVIGSSAGGLQPLLDLEMIGVDAAQKAIEKQNKVKFDIVTCDAKGDISALRKCGEDAVAAKPAAVLVADPVQAAAGLPATFQSAGIPVFWVVTTTNAESQAGDTAMIPISGLLSGIGGLGAGSARAGFKKDAVITRPQILEDQAKNLIAVYEAAGGTVKATTEVPLVFPGAPNPPDLAPYAQKVVDEDPKVAMIIGSNDLFQQERTAGYDGPVVIADVAGTGFDDLLKSLPSDITKDLYKASSSPPLDLVKPLPSVKKFVKEVKAAGHTDPNDPSSWAWNAWVSMYVIADQVAGMTDVTAASLLEALNTSKGITLVSGETWVPSAPGPAANPRDSSIVYWFSKYAGNGKWKLVKTPPTGVVIPVSFFEAL